MLAAISFYSLVKIVHIASVLIAFGVTFAYPVIGSYAERSEPAALPFFHRTQQRVARLLLTPFATLLLISGSYLAADADAFDQAWVGAGFLIIVVLLGLAGAFFSPTERKLAELAARDVAAAGDGPIELSPEYRRLLARLKVVTLIAAGLVLVAVGVMVEKPGA